MSKENPLTVKYVLGELTLEDILPYGLESVRIDKHELPAVVLKRRKRHVLVWIDDIPVDDMPDFEIPMDAKVARIIGNEAEIRMESVFQKNIELLRLYIKLGRSPGLF